MNIFHFNCHFFISSQIMIACMILTQYNTI